MCALQDPAVAAQMKQMQEAMARPEVQQQMAEMQAYMQNQQVQQRMQVGCCLKWLTGSTGRGDSCTCPSL